MSFSDIVELTLHVPLIVVQLRCDLAAPNVRLIHYYAELCQLHNEGAAQSGRGFILLLDCPCAAHVIHRIIEKTYSTAKLIPQLHSVSYCCGPPGNLKAIGKALFDIVTRDLEAGGFLPHSRPDGSWRAVHQRLLDISLLRSLSTRGRDLDKSKAKREHILKGLVQVVLGLLNGDWSQPFFQHYCYEPGCCEGRSVTVAARRITALIMQIVFDPLGERLPSTSRWYTFPRALDIQCFGAFCLQRSVETVRVGCVTRFVRF